MGGIVGLINLISWEVCRIDVRGELRLERCTYAAKRIEVNSSEELVVLDLLGRNSPKSMFGVANKAGSRSVRHTHRLASQLTFGSNSLLRVPAEHPRENTEIGAS